MEDSIDVMLQEQSARLLYFSQNNRSVTLWTSAIFAGFYGLWAMFVMPGLKVPLRLKVPYVPSTKEQTMNVMKLLEGRKGRLADLGSGDGRLADLSRYNNVTVFLAPTVMKVLEEKLLSELPEGARVVVCRFPFPHWPHTCSEGAGLHKVWAYDIRSVPKTYCFLSQ